MKVMLGMGHPAHIHFFKNIIWTLEKRGHEVFVVARDREIALNLLDHYKFNYSLFAKYKKNIFLKAAEIPINDYTFWKAAKDFKPDIFAGILNYTSSHIGKITGKPSVIFTDTENASLANKLVCPFADYICTPSCYTIDFGDKQIKYDGYHELSYLHPDNYTPNPEILDLIDVNQNEKYIVLRIVSWNAVHDIGESGFKDLKKLISKFEEHGKVFISSEAKLGSEFDKYKLNIPAYRMHDLLNYANLYIGESSTMASESAVLGTPAIYYASSSRGYIDELTDKYGLMYNYTGIENGEALAIKKGLELLENENLKQQWTKKKEKMLSDKINVSDFAVNLLEKIANDK